MIADSMSRLCIVPAERTSTMTTREMLSVNVSDLMQQSTAQHFNESEENLAFYNMMDEEDILVEEELDVESPEGEDRRSSGHHDHRRA